MGDLSQKEQIEFLVKDNRELMEQNAALLAELEKYRTAETPRFENGKEREDEKD